MPITWKLEATVETQYSQMVVVQNLRKNHDTTVNTKISKILKYF